MRRTLLVLMLASAVTMTGCGGTNEQSIDNAEHNSNQVENNADSETLGVDKKLFNVEVTIPSDLLEIGDEDIDMDKVVGEAKEEGIKDVTLNDDGSVTYVMSKSTHKKKLDEMRREMQDLMEDIATDENFESIKDIKSNKNFTEFDLIVEKALFENNLDAFAIMGIVFPAMFYQLFDGVDPDNYEAIINVQDEESGEVFDTYVYPDQFED